MPGIRSAAQDGRITCFQAKPARIRGNVRSALENDADNAQRRSDTLDMKAVRPVPFGDDGANGIRKPGDRLEAGCHGFDPRCIEAQAVQKGIRQGARLRRIHVSDIVTQKRFLMAPYRTGHCFQRQVLGVGRRLCQHSRRGPCLAPDFIHGAFDVVDPGFFIKIKHGHRSPVRFRLQPRFS